MKQGTQLARDGGVLVDPVDLAQRLRGEWWMQKKSIDREAADCIERQLRLLKRMRNLLGWQCPEGQEDELDAVDADLLELGIKTGNGERE